MEAGASDDYSWGCGDGKYETSSCSNSSPEILVTCEQEIRSLVACKKVKGYNGK